MKSKSDLDELKKNFLGEMQKFKYGLLIWNSVNEDDESVIFLEREPPVEYDRIFQLTMMACSAYLSNRLFTSWQLILQLEYNDFLEFEIRSISLLESGLMIIF